MRVVQINSTCGTGSTGRICLSVSLASEQTDIDNHIAYSIGHSDHPRAHSFRAGLPTRWQALFSRVLGNYGFNSRAATRRLLRLLDSLSPDIVHLHNLHSHDCHVGKLLAYLKRRGTKVIWTFHDCWAYTGYCPHYDMVGCTAWQTECGNCPQRRAYSWFFDRSRLLQRRKRRALTGLDLTVVTPSRWLADQVRQSFLGDRPIHVIHNGIDLSVFHPTESDVRTRLGIGEGQHMLLAVAFGWDRRKGLDALIRLAETLPDTYRLVLVGTDDRVDRLLPPSVISVHRTHDAAELAAYYSSADLLVNPTREENYPTVNMEALACGTPVLTFRTGGSPEILDETCGSVVACDDMDALVDEIIRICSDRPYSREACLERARAFDQNERFKEYVQLYERIIAARAERDRA